MVYFSGAPTIYCYEYSDAEGFAIDNFYPVVLLDGLDFDDIRTVSLPYNFRLECGTSRKLIPAVFPDDQPAIQWTSSNPAVVSVENGLVTAVAPGAATVTATVGTASASVTVTAYAVATDFALSETEVWLVAKENLQLALENIQPEGAEAAVSWSTSDTTLATVDGNGFVTTKKPGDVTITATSDNGTARSCLIHLCYPVTAIDLTPESLEIPSGASAQLTADVTMRTQTCVNHLVTFASSDESVATVDANGLVTAMGSGAATITASANGISASCAILVPASHSLILPADLTAIEPEAFQNDAALEAVVIPEGCASIGPRAFAGCASLRFVTLPGDIAIDETAFAGCTHLTFRCPSGSAAMAFAQAHGFNVIPAE